jgi:hypothetical protein
LRKELKKMANTATNVSVGKPAVAGSIYVAPLGTTLPTDTSTALDAAFKSLGFVSEDGVTNSNSMETDDIKEWGGATVLSLQTSKDDTFQFTLIEALNADVLKTVYGASNVTGTLATGLTIKANADDPAQYSWVVEMVLRGGVAKRIVIPAASITELGDIAYTTNDAIGYEVTLTATPDSAGNTHYEYLKSA